MARDSWFHCVALQQWIYVVIHFSVIVDCLRLIQFSSLVHCNTEIFSDLTVQWQLDCWWSRDVPASGCWHISGCAPAGCRGDTEGS